MCNRTSDWDAHGSTRVCRCLIHRPRNNDMTKKTVKSQLVPRCAKQRMEDVQNFGSYSKRNESCTCQLAVSENEQTETGWNGTKAG